MHNIGRHTAYLGLGSNVDAQKHIRIAIDALQAECRDVELSPMYQSAAVGFDGGDFINLVARVETQLDALALRDWLRALEDRYGRQRDVPKFSDRVLDVDILLFDDLITQEGPLEIPRGEILRFAHVLKPLTDLAPDLIYPGDTRSLSEIWAESDLSKVTLISLNEDFQPLA